jgi:hypothetical protein
MSEAWEVVTRPMLVGWQRPEYCPCVDDETHPTCPVCPATVKGDDIVQGVCQAIKSGPPPRDLVEIVLVRK